MDWVGSRRMKVRRERDKSIKPGTRVKVNCCGFEGMFGTVAGESIEQCFDYSVKVDGLPQQFLFNRCELETLDDEPND